MRRGVISASIIVVFFFIILLSYSGGGLPDEFPAPDFVLHDIFTGKSVDLVSLKGRPVILYFFASW
jgi:cytochrome oxidase Cu insertion factor (SCO1/SenC/PrrC family)